MALPKFSGSNDVWALAGAIVASSNNTEIVLNNILFMAMINHSLQNIRVYL
jgi:hypothetical protein